MSTADVHTPLVAQRLHGSDDDSCLGLVGEAATGRALLQPARSEDFAASLLAMDAAWGGLPLWPALSSDGDMMIGDGAAVVLADLALQGLADPQAALDVVHRFPDLQFQPNLG